MFTIAYSCLLDVGWQDRSTTHFLLSHLHWILIETLGGSGTSFSYSMSPLEWRGNGCCEKTLYSPKWTEQGLAGVEGPISDSPCQASGSHTAESPWEREQWIFLFWNFLLAFPYCVSSLCHSLKLFLPIPSPATLLFFPVSLKIIIRKLLLQLYRSGCSVLKFLDTSNILKFHIKYIKIHESILQLFKNSTE